MPITLEIVCASADDAVEAEAGGADRIELCSSMFVGGLTPSLGTLLEVKRRVRLPVMAMVRPRGGGFCYSPGEFVTMLRDAEVLLKHGADGIVFGILREDGRIDVKRTAQISKVVGSKQTVFHRAFDVTPDPFAALEELMALGITRVLSSGQQPTALEGVELIRRLVGQAQGRIEILVGGGVRANNVSELLARTGCSQVHLKAFTRRMDTSLSTQPQIRFNHTSVDEGGYELTDRAMVRQMRDTLDSYAEKT